HFDGAFEPEPRAVDIALEDQRLCPREQFALACRRGVLFTTRRFARSCGRRHGAGNRGSWRTEFAGTPRCAVTSIVWWRFWARRPGVRCDDLGAHSGHLAHLVAGRRKIAIEALRS